MDEHVLLEATATGDKRAFTELYRLYVARVAGYLRQSLPTAVAEDVAQEVFVRVWRQAGRYERSRGSVSTWILSIARNARIDALRRSGRPAPDPTDPSWVPVEPPAPDRVLEQRRTEVAVQSALTDLPSAQLEVLERAYVRGQSLAEIAVETGVPLGTIKSRARMALATLRVHFPSPDEHG